MDDSIARYLIELDRADRTPDLVMPERIDHINDKITSMKAQLSEFKHIGARMAQAEDGQLSLTDPDARSMATRGRGTGVVGYNVQVAVDTKHHLIVVHEVTNAGHDRTQLLLMAQKARAAIDQPHLTALADRGYFKSEEILACDRAVLLRWCQSHSPQAIKRPAYLIKRISSTCQPPMSIAVPPATITGCALSSGCRPCRPDQNSPRKKNTEPAIFK